MTITQEDYRKIFKTKNGRVYLEELPKVAKIISGQSFLYRTKGTRSMVIDLYLTEKIEPQLLQIAVNRSLKRFPYLTSSLVKKNDQYYLSHNEYPVVIAQQHNLCSLGSKEVNYHLIDITFEQNRLVISYHHALVDGRGILPFVRTLLYYYLNSKLGHTLGVSEIDLANDPMLLEEMQEPFGEFKNFIPNESSSNEFKNKVFSLPENEEHSSQTTNWRYEIEIDEDSLLKFSKARNATPAIAVSLILSQAIYRAYPNTVEPIMINLASDLRSGITYKKTARNCVNSIVFPVNTQLTSTTEFIKMATEFRKQINIQKTPKQIRQTIQRMKTLFNKLETMQYSEKQQLMSFLDKNTIDTFILSYSGQLKMGALEKHINKIHTYMSGTKGLSVQMLAVNKKICIDMIQEFPSDIYVKLFKDILDENNIYYTGSKKLPCETPHSAI